MKAGTLGQVKGPFKAGENAIAAIGGEQTLRFGISIDKKDFMSFKDDFIFNINGQEFHMSKACVYEVDESVSVSSIVFPNGAPESVIINYVAE